MNNKPIPDESSWDGKIHVCIEPIYGGGLCVTNESNGNDMAGHPFGNYQQAKSWALKQGYLVTESS